MSEGTQPSYPHSMHPTKSYAVGDERSGHKLVYPIDVGVDEGNNTPFWQCRSEGPCWHSNGPRVSAEIR